MHICICVYTHFNYLSKGIREHISTYDVFSGLLIENAHTKTLLLG